MVLQPDWPVKDIYTGFWINRSRGKFYAATLTVDQRLWNLIVAFIALFVGAAARSIWKLIRFALHYKFSSQTTRDGVHNQRQAVLRNTPLATDAAIQLLEVSYVWRHRAQEGTARTLILFSLALAISVSTTAAGIFSSRILTTSTNDVLIISPNCGALLSGPSVEYNVWRSRWAKYTTQKMVEDLSYATRCYGSQDPGYCDKFAQADLPYTIYRNASCPFAPELCQSSFGNLLLDAGNIDSVRHLGLNAGPSFSLRYRTHCPPLKTMSGEVVIS
ncbi:hypothetical protein BU25DRAFT_400704, partial [Macroventuria anomochaeta]